MSESKDPATETEQPTTRPKHHAWARHLDVIGDELLRLTTIAATCNCASRTSSTAC